jgi:hypothetical protein
MRCVAVWCDYTNPLYLSSLMLYRRPLSAGCGVEQVHVEICPAPPCHALPCSAISSHLISYALLKEMLQNEKEKTNKNQVKI